MASKGGQGALIRTGLWVLAGLLLLCAARAHVGWGRLALSVQGPTDVHGGGAGGHNGGKAGAAERLGGECSGAAKPPPVHSGGEVQWHGMFYILAGVMLWPILIFLIWFLANRGYLGFARTFIRWFVTRAHDELNKWDGETSEPAASPAGSWRGEVSRLMSGGRAPSSGGSSWSSSWRGTPSVSGDGDAAPGEGRRRQLLSDVCEEDCMSPESLNLSQRMLERRERREWEEEDAFGSVAELQGGGASCSSWNSSFSQPGGTSEASQSRSASASGEGGGHWADREDAASPSKSGGGRRERGGGGSWGVQVMMTDEELCAELDAEDDARIAVLACKDDASLVFDHAYAQSIADAHGPGEPQRQRSISLGFKHSAGHRMAQHRDREAAVSHLLSYRDPTPPRSPGSCGEPKGAGGDDRWMSRYLKDFEEMGRIGRGGFGSVYCARQKLDGREYAVKKVKLSVTDEAQNKRVAREVKNMAALSAHPNIVRYYGTWVEADGRVLGDTIDGIQELRQQGRVAHKWLYIQMELCSTSLRRWMDEQSAGLPLEDVHTMVKEVAEGLRFMHSEGFIHRDVKPENIFIVSGVAKLGDFGLSCKTGGHLHEAFQTDSSDTTGSSADSDRNEDLLEVEHTRGVGTSMYTAPELAKNGKYDAKVDIYSLGIVLFELLVPFNTRSERAIVLQSLRAALQTPSLAAATSLLGCPSPATPPTSAPAPGPDAGGDAGGAAAPGGGKSPASSAVSSAASAASTSTVPAPGVMSQLPRELLALAKTHELECSLVVRLLSLYPRLRPSASEVLETPLLQTTMEETVRRQKDQIRLLKEKMEKLQRLSPSQAAQARSSGASPPHRSGSSERGRNSLWEPPTLQLSPMGVVVGGRIRSLQQEGWQGAAQSPTKPGPIVVFPVSPLEARGAIEEEEGDGGWEPCRGGLLGGVVG